MSQNALLVKLESLVKEDWEFIPRTFVTSTVKGTGRREILGFIEELNGQVAAARAENQPD